VLEGAPKALPRLGAVLLSTLASWIVYVPLHELLHAFGCVASGGEVRELEIQPLYGGVLLSKVFPFVRAGGDYAGRLTGFDTRGSDLIYLATDLAPFLLTVVAAFPLLQMARSRRSAVLLGPGLVLAAAPLTSLTGDLYEMGSIVVSAALGRLSWDVAGSLQLLRHDDLFVLLGEFGGRFPDHQALWASAVAGSLLVGWLAGNAILLAGHRLGERLLRAAARRPRLA